MAPTANSTKVAGSGTAAGAPLGDASNEGSAGAVLAEGSKMNVAPPPTANVVPAGMALKFVTYRAPGVDHRAATVGVVAAAEDQRVPAQLCQSHAAGDAGVVR